KYGKCQSGSISATPSAEMNSVEMTFAIAVLLQIRCCRQRDGPSIPNWSDTHRPLAPRAADGTPPNTTELSDAPGRLPRHGHARRRPPRPRAPRRPGPGGRIEPAPP